MTKWSRCLWWLFLLVVLALVAGGGPWWSLRAHREVLRERIRTAADALNQCRMRELARAWSTPGPAARQAAWNVVKIDWFLQRNRPLDGKVEPTEALRTAVLQNLERLLAAENQSRLGCRQMTEEEDRGARLRGYLSGIDSSLQTYSLSLPTVYDPAVTWPLIVSLHGHGWWGPYQGHPAPRYAGAFCLAPQGRGATDYMELGEIDVLEAIDQVCADYSIDRNRIYLTGGSMGGTGSWHLGVHHADRFAGLMPICGNADSNAWTYRWGWNRRFGERFDALRDWLQEAQTPRAYARNLLNLPSYCFHGSADTVVPPEHSRYMVAELHRWGCPVEYREFLECGHGGMPGASVSEGQAWTCAQVRDPYPARVRWRAARLRQGHAYWLRLQQMARPCEFAQIEAEAGPANRVTIQTQNLLAFDLEQAPELFDLTRPLVVTCDGDRVIFSPLRDEPRRWRSLVRDPALGWVDAVYASSREGDVKSPGREGPISEVLLAPFVLVVGTLSSDPIIRDLWWAEGLAFAREWKRRNGASCSLIRDIDCTDSIMESRHLILFGGPADNGITARLTPWLPIRELAERGQEGIPLDGATAESTFLFHAPDVGLFLLYPNLLHRERLAVVVAAGGPPAIYQCWQRFGNWFNWGVFDSTKYFDFAMYDARTASPESFLLLGYFGTDWSIAKGVWKEPIAKSREQFAPQHFPPYRTVPVCPEGLDLFELRPRAIDQMRGAIGLGRTFFGRPLDKSIGVRAPAFIEYDIEGQFERLITGACLINEPENASCAARFDSEKLTVIIKGDGKVLAKNEDLSWKRPLITLDADLTGVRILRLEATVSGGPAWLHGSAAWIQPRLLRNARR